MNIKILLIFITFMLFTYQSSLHKIFQIALKSPRRISLGGKLNIPNAPVSGGLMEGDSGNAGINASWVVLGFDYLGTDPLFGITERNVASH